MSIRVLRQAFGPVHAKHADLIPAHIYDADGLVVIEFRGKALRNASILSCVISVAGSVGVSAALAKPRNNAKAPHVVFCISFTSAKSFEFQPLRILTAIHNLEI